MLQIPPFKHTLPYTQFDFQFNLLDPLVTKPKLSITSRVKDPTSTVRVYGNPLEFWSFWRFKRNPLTRPRAGKEWFMNKQTSKKQMKGKRARLQHKYGNSETQSAGHPSSIEKHGRWYRDLWFSQTDEKKEDELKRKMETKKTFLLVKQTDELPFLLSLHVYINFAPNILRIFFNKYFNIFNIIFIRNNNKFNNIFLSKIIHSN